MAEQKATSRSLDYSLGGDILDRLKAAEESKYFDKDAEGNIRGRQGIAAAALGKVSEKLTAKATELDTIKKEKEEEQKELQGKVDDAEIKFDKSFKILGDRGGWTTPRIYDIFTNKEKTFKEAYLDAVENEDKVLANSLLNQQDIRFTSMNNWKGSIEAAKEVFDGGKGLEWSKMLTDDPEKLHILTKINEQGADVEVDIDPDTNECFFIIPTADGKGTQEVRLSEYDDLVDLLKPTDFELDFYNGVDATYKSAKEGKMTEFDFKRGITDNKKLVTKKNIEKLYTDELWNGQTFGEILMDHPDFQPENLANLMEKRGTYIKIPDHIDVDADGVYDEEFEEWDVKPDGYLDYEEIVNLSEYDKMIIFDLLMAKDEDGDLINFDMAQGYLSEFMTLLQNQNFNKGNKEYTDFQKENKGKSRRDK